MLHPPLRLAIATLWAIAAPITAQGLAPDEDRSLWPRRPSIGPNDRPAGARPRLVISSPTVWENASFRIDDGGDPNNPNPCDLVLAAGGKLTLRNARLEVVGDVILEDAGMMHVEDSDLELFNRRASSEFAYLWEGGHLSTLRATIGGRRERSFYSRFALDDGLWTAEDTTVHDSGGIQVGRPLSTRPEFEGGTLIAEGLFAGEIADFLHVNDRGDAFLTRSSFSIRLRLPKANAASSAIPAALDLGTGQVIGSRVYGDKTVRSGVTHHIPGADWRLTMRDCTVPRWGLHVFDVGGPEQRTIELRNADNVTIGIHGDQMFGRPTLVGPWRTYYPTGPLPELPATREPGHHAIPPGCGIKIGGTEIRSAPGHWSRVITWSLYLERPPVGVTPSNFAVRGPTTLSEFFVSHGSLLLEGNDAFDMGVFGLEALAIEQGRATVRNATLGTWAGPAASITAAGRGVINLDQVKVRNCRLQTRAQRINGSEFNVDRGTVTMTNHFPVAVPGEVLQLVTSSSGTISVSKEPPSGNRDMQNLDFEGSVPGGVPDHWSGIGVSGQRVSSTGPTGGVAFRYVGTGSSGQIWKRLMLPVGARVEVYGRLGPSRSGNGNLRCAIEGVGSGRRSVSNLTPAAGAWSGFQVASYVVSPQDTAVDIVFGHTGGQVQVDVDDIEVRLANFWESDNLRNLDFEEPVQQQTGLPPFRWVAPNHWNIIEGQATIETGDLGPGTSGSQSVKVVTTHRKAVLSKSLYFLRPGDRIRVTGKIKVVHLASNGRYPLFVNVGAGRTYYSPTSPCNNRQWWVHSATSGSATWQNFSVDYDVPGPSTCNAPGFGETRIGINGGKPGDWFVVDDIKVTLR